MRPYEPSLKIAVRDNPDDDLSDDVEDDVFIRDGRSTKAQEENGLKRPLMAPRRKSNKYSTSVSSIFKKRRKCWKCCEPFCYGLAALTIIIAIIFLVALLVTMFPVTFQKVKTWLRKDVPLYTNSMQSEFDLFKGEIVPCTQISVHKVWSKAFSKMISESPIRKYDINGDSLDDIIFGYGIDDNFEYNDDPNIPKCEMGGELINCEGGIIALDGSSGDTLWQRWTAFNVFSIYCSQDLNNDSINDCIASGRGGLVIGINGQNGNILWQLKDEIDMAGLTSSSSSASITIDLYTVNAIRDLDDDGVADVLAVHVEQNSKSHAGHIKLLSGRTGNVIRSIPTPNLEEVFVPLQMVTQFDGTENLLILTGGQNTPGGIYETRLNSMMKYTSKSDFSSIFQSLPCGFMVPAILSDITNDSIADIIVSSFNSTVYAFDGKTYNLLWNYTFPGSESVSSIVPGHFNNDNVTDFMVKYNIGPGFPIYYYSQTTILNGIDGTSLLEQMMNDSGGPVNLLAGVSVSQTFGGDFFLHWQSICRDKYNYTDVYQFIPGSDMIQQSRADTCKLRYNNTSTVLKLYAIARHIEPPGAVIFSTDDLILQLNQSNIYQMQRTNSVSALKHPKMLKKIMNNNNKEIMNRNDYASLTSSDEKSINLSGIYKKNYDDLNLNNNIIYDNNNNIINNNIDNMKDESNINNNNNNNLIYGNILPDSMYPPSYIQSNKIYEQQSPLQQQQQQQQQQLLLPDMGNPEEYESYYNEEQSDRKIPMRTKYPVNRDIRSKIDDEIDFIFPDDENSTQLNENENKIVKDNSIMKNMQNHNFNKIEDEEQPETLWDLEMEKEETEETNDIKNNNDYTRRTIRQEEINQNVLASISSTGVLLKPVDDAPSAIDFVFILNVRESEMYPPLILPEDLACIADKMSGYRNFQSDDDILTFEKKFLKQCLQQRLPNLTPHSAKFEAQIVITRISIKCSCGNLRNGEICSKLNTIDKQKWTEFMGNSGNGVY